MIQNYTSEHFFENPYYETDLHALFKKNISAFTPEEKNRLLELIETGPGFFGDAEDREPRINMWRQTWYSSLKNDAFFTQYYEKYRTVTQVDERDVFSEGTVRYGPGSSPKNRNDLFEMPGKDLAAFLKTYSSENQWAGPNVNGLASELVALFGENPGKISDSWGAYSDIPYIHMVHILWGLRNACDKKNEIPWNTVFALIKIYIEHEDFWNGSRKKEEDRWQASVNWVIEQICELITAATKSKAPSFSPDQQTLAEQILSFIFEHSEILRPKDKNEEGSNLDYALNSTLGKAVYAQINLFLCQTRATSTEQRNAWPESSQAKYTHLLEQDIVEAYTFLGSCLPNFYYLDKTWAEKQVIGMVSQSNERLWTTFFSGYLYVGTIYPDIFAHMIPHYQKALTKATEDKAERLLEHVTFAYLQKYETIDGPLFGFILEKWCPKWMMSVISFLWRYRGTQDDSIVKGVIDFWEYCYNQLKEKVLDQQSKEMLSDLSQLSCFLKEITDENLKWILLSAPFVELETSFTFFYRIP